jgi:hypothetical protein
MSEDLTISEVAARYKVTPRAARRWLKLFPNAYIEETRRGPVWLVPEGDLKDFQPPPVGRPRKPKTEQAVKKGGKKGGKK